MVFGLQERFLQESKSITCYMSNNFNLKILGYLDININVKILFYFSLFDWYNLRIQFWSEEIILC